MTDNDAGWDWFDAAANPPDEETLKSDMGLALAFAKCFRGKDGGQVLKYLRSLTMERALGPNASDSFLRHVEGQRQLVSHIFALVERGRGGDNQNTK